MMAFVPWGPLFPFTLPVDGDFAWINQDAGGSVDATKGGIYLLAAPVGGDNLRIRIKAAPATPYTITAAILPQFLQADYSGCGLCWRQSSDGKIVSFGHSYTGKLAVTKWTDEHNWSALALEKATVHNVPLFLRIADNGVNRICSFSEDGQFWLLMHTVGRTDYLTANQVGFYANSNNVTWPAALTLLSWKAA
jgi:hypothetical protein